MVGSDGWIDGWIHEHIMYHIQRWEGDGWCVNALCTMYGGGEVVGGRDGWIDACMNALCATCGVGSAGWWWEEGIYECIMYHVRGSKLVVGGRDRWMHECIMYYMYRCMFHQHYVLVCICVYIQRRRVVY